MKLINKKGIICFLALTLSPIALIAAPAEKLNTGNSGRLVQLAHDGGWHGGHGGGWHGGGWGGHGGGWGGHGGGWHGGGGRWVGGVWYGGSGVSYGGCRSVQVNRRICGPHCHWSYRYQAERCTARCYIQPFWERRCW